MPDPPPSSSQDPARRWRERVYQGDRVPQLTARALGTGALVGAVMGISNLYVGLRIGWSLGVVITASILGWAAWQAAQRVGLMRRPPTILEANAMASTASAAGYSTGTTLCSAMAALLLVTGESLPLWQLMAWLACVSTLGLMVAVPLRRPLVVDEALPFPTGAAAAQTLRSLYGSPDDARTEADAEADAPAPPHAAARRARTLLLALAAGVLLELLTGVVPVLAEPLGLPAWLALPDALPTAAMQHALPWLAGVAAHGFVLELSGLLLAAGVLVGWRVAWSLLLGAVLCHGVLAPALLHAGVIPSLAYRDVVAWSVWPGATMMVVAGLVAFASQGRRVWPRWLPSRARSGRELDSTARAEPLPDPLADLEVPRRWVLWGGGAAGCGCVLLSVTLFDVPVLVAVLSVGMAVALAGVAARVTGQTDLTPMGPLGKVAQLAGGVLLPGRVAPNLMVASVTAGAAASAADLLTDWKSGHLLGAHPRRQFLAQLVGVGVGVLVTVPVFRYVLVPDAAALGGERWPAPAARVWASVSAVVTQGLAAIPPSAWWATALAAALALLLGLLERHRPAWSSRFLPSATGLGLAFVLPASSALSFFVGGLCAVLVARRRPQALASHAVPIAAGLIAGESLMGVASAMLAGWAPR